MRREPHDNRRSWHVLSTRRHMCNPRDYLLRTFRHVHQRRAPKALLREAGESRPLGTLCAFGADRRELSSEQ